MKTEQRFLYHIQPDDQVPTDLRHSNNDSQGHNSGGHPQHKGMSPWIRSLLLVGIMLAIWYLVPIFLSPGTQTNGRPVVEIPYSTFYQQVEAGNVKNAIIAGQEVTGEFKQAVTVKDTKGASQTVTRYRATQLPNGDPHLVTLLNEHQVEYQVKPVGEPNLLLGILINILPWVLLFGLFYFMAHRATQALSLTLIGQREQKRSEQEKEIVSTKRK